MTSNFIDEANKVVDETNTQRQQLDEQIRSKKTALAELKDKREKFEQAVRVTRKGLDDNEQQLNAELTELTRQRDDLQQVIDNTQAEAADNSSKEIVPVTPAPVSNDQDDSTPEPAAAEPVKVADSPEPTPVVVPAVKASSKESKKDKDDSKSKKGKKSSKADKSGDAPKAQKDKDDSDKEPTKTSALKQNFKRGLDWLREHQA